MPWAIEQCALQSPLAQQHRNKVGLQARAILKTLAARLIERQEADMLRLLEQAGFDPALATISRDSSGLALLVDVTAN